MTRRSALLAAALAAAACAKKPDFEVFRDPSGQVAVEVPSGWGRDGDDGLGRKPMSAVSFVGEVAVQDEGVPLGAVLSVTRFSRNRSDYPAEKAVREYWETNVLLPTEALFGDVRPSKPAIKEPEGLAKDVRDATLGGLAGKSYRREYVHRAGGRPLHGQIREVPMRLVGVIVRTPEAYFVLEYRATKTLFDKHYPAFEKAQRSFRLLESGKG